MEPAQPHQDTKNRQGTSFSQCVNFLVGLCELPGSGCANCLLGTLHIDMFLLVHWGGPGVTVQEVGAEICDELGQLGWLGFE